MESSRLRTMYHWDSTQALQDRHWRVDLSRDTARHSRIMAVLCRRALIDRLKHILTINECSRR